MRVAVLIAARTASTRLPGKVLSDIGGVPLITRLIARVRLARRPAAVVLCTSRHPDDAPLVELAEVKGVNWVAGAERNLLERFLDGLRLVGANVAVRVTGDNPLTDPELLDALIDLHAVSRAEYTYTVDTPRGTRSEVVSRSALEKALAQAEDPESSEYMTQMLRQPDYFRQAVYRVRDPMLVRPQYRLSVDTPEDLAVVRAVYQAFDYRDDMSLREIIRFLDGRPDVRALNAHIKSKAPEAWVNTTIRR